MDPAWRGLTEFFESAWVSAGEPPLGDDEMAWMRALRLQLLEQSCEDPAATHVNPL